MKQMSGSDLQSEDRSNYAPAFPVQAKYRRLIWELAKREVFGRYRGANLGMLWSLLGPFLMLGVYMLAMGGILRARWPGADSAASFGLILFVGLIIHALFAECLVRAPTLVAGNPNYVKRIMFPLEVLPWPVLLSGLFHLGVNFVVLALSVWAIRGTVPATILLVPLAIMPLALWALGILWMLGALGVYLRDISQITPPIASMMLFLSSAIVPIDVISPGQRWLFRINPLTPVIDAVRHLSLDGVFPDWVQLAWWTGMALLWAMMSYVTFCKLRKGFADVL